MARPAALRGVQPALLSGQATAGAPGWCHRADLPGGVPPGPGPALAKVTFLAKEGVRISPFGAMRRTGTRFALLSPCQRAIRRFYCAFLQFCAMPWSCVDRSYPRTIARIKRLGQHFSLRYPQA